MKNKYISRFLTSLLYDDKNHKAHSITKSFLSFSAVKKWNNWKNDEICFLIRYLFLFSISTGEAGGDRNILQDWCIFMFSDNIYNYFIIIQKRVQKWWYVSIFNNILFFIIFFHTVNHFFLLRIPLILHTIRLILLKIGRNKTLYFF